MALSAQRREILRWIADSVRFTGAARAVLYPHGGGWYPWPSGYSEPTGLRAPRRRPRWRDVQALVRGGYLRRNEPKYRTDLSPKERVHLLTNEGWTAAGVVRPAKGYEMQRGGEHAPRQPVVSTRGTGKGGCGLLANPGHARSAVEAGASRSPEHSSGGGSGASATALQCALVFNLGAGVDAGIGHERPIADRQEGSRR